MAKLPWMQFYPADYLLDTQPLSPSSRGLWMDLICLLWRCETRGTLTLSQDQWIRLLRCDAATFETATMEYKLFSICEVVTNRHGDVTVRSRRMMREEKQRKTTRLRVQRYRRNKGGNASVQDCNRENHISEVRSQNQKSESEVREEKNIVGLTPNEAPVWGDASVRWKDAEELVAFLNERTGKHFQARTPAGQPTKTLTLIRQLLKQRYSVVQIRQVIANRWLKWGQDPKMQEFLRPSTLFRPTNFENYLGELGVGS